MEWVVRQGGEFLIEKKIYDSLSGGMGGKDTTSKWGKKKERAWKGLWGK